jgi:hypothetical protein
MIVARLPVTRSACLVRFFFWIWLVSMTKLVHSGCNFVVQCLIWCRCGDFLCCYLIVLLSSNSSCDSRACEDWMNFCALVKNMWRLIETTWCETISSVHCLELRIQTSSLFWISEMFCYVCIIYAEFLVCWLLVFSNPCYYVRCWNLSTLRRAMLGYICN